MLDSVLKYLGLIQAPTELSAAPGLVTVLDFALYRSVEGELTATISAAHALLHAWLDLKHRSRRALRHEPALASKQLIFVRTCLEAACDAIEKLSTDRLAPSANLTDAYESSENFSSTILSGHTNFADSKLDTGRRTPSAQRRADCWETCRLICPDHVWAEDVITISQRLLRHLTKLTSSLPALDRRYGSDRETLQLIELLHSDLPTRLHQFKTATEANAIVIKRLYMVKCEYRAPFRVFLEAHQTVQRAPPIEMVEKYVQGNRNSNNNNKREEQGKQQQQQQQANNNLFDRAEYAKRKLDLIEALAIENTCEQLETSMAQAISGFTELARLVDNKRAKLRVVPGVVEQRDIRPLSELLRRLKFCLCRKVSPETSSGIRPILLDLQGMPRDEDISVKPMTTKERVELFLSQLEQLALICKTDHSFSTEKGNLDIQSSIVKSCAKLDSEMWQAQWEDWLMLVKAQHGLVERFGDLAEQLRSHEIETTIRSSSLPTIKLVKGRVEVLLNDRQKKFEVLKEMVEELCQREMNWQVNLVAPPKYVVLELPTTSVLGMLGLPLKMSGEPLPIG